MSKLSVKMKASVAILFVNLVIETIERIKASPDLLVLDSNFYIMATIFTTMIYFIILHLYINQHITDHRTKVAVVAVSLGTIVVILPIRFFLSPPRWDFEFRLIFTIDKVSVMVLFLLTYIRDPNLKIFSTLFLSLIGVFIVRHTDPHLQPFNTITMGSLCTVIYAITFWLYMRVNSERKWKIATLVFFILIMFGIILVYIWSFRFSRWDPLFYILFGTDIPLVMTYPLYKSSYEMLQSAQGDFLELSELPTRFTFEDMRKATRNFRTPIGQGGSSTVYKGMLSDGSNVAVKRIKSQSSGEDEFNTEITILASLQHINLVHLLGYCLTPRGERYLVYPFFQNGSLNAWLFAVEEKRRQLTWKLRYQIAVDVAKALAYLHHDCRHRILHLDVKPENILLGDAFRAKLSDFGISRAMNREDSNVMTRGRGTIGYLSPEMLIPTAISTKSDVYSYGMVLLELVGGRRNFQSIIDRETRQRKNTYFPKIVRKKMLEGRLMEVFDTCLVNEQIKEDEVRVLVSAAFWCIQGSPELRPSMADVVDMLEGNLAVHSPPESPMYVMNCLDLDLQCTTSESIDSDTARRRSGYETNLLSDDTISICIE